MSVGRSLLRLLFGVRERIAGTIYGTIVAMGAITAGSGARTEPFRLAGIVVATVLVLWVAHVYSHALAESINQGRKLDRAEFLSVAGRELGLPLAAVAPVAALLLGGFGVIRESRAVWLAIGLGVGTLAVEGFRYARLEHVGRRGTVTAVAVNVLLGLVIVALKAGLAH